MKPNFKKVTLLLAGLMASGAVLAQTADTVKKSIYYVKPFAPKNSFRTLSVGVGLGVLTDYTILNGQSNYETHKVELGYSGFIKEQILPALGVQADVFFGKLEASEARFNDANGNRYQRFDTKINWALSGSFVYTFANINWRNHRSLMQPYATLGGGAITYSPSYTLQNGQTNTITRGSGQNFQEFFIPLGIGTKISVAPGVNIDLGYTINFVNANNVFALTSPQGNDRFSYAHGGIEFVLGDKRKPQLATYNPVSSMYYDYTTQASDLRTQQQVMEQNMKIEQQNLEAQLAAQKAANDRMAADLAKATADSDGDGVSDLFDKCPNTPAGTKVDGSGCPLIIPKAENVKVYITEEDRKVVKDAIANLEFDLGKATIRAHSLPSLDKVAELLVNKNFSLKLAGHTDNTGSADLNMRLSKDRAESIKAYLVSKGANASRIEATGYGMTQPIATNKTAKGRQQNRRVEFTLY
jgi:OOP family OmpA-OmpF porin